MPDLTPFVARLLPARGDLAAADLAGRVPAARYTAGAPRRVAVPLLDLTAEPDREAPLATQLLWGERFVVYDECDGLAWGQATRDGYVGYVAVEGLAPEEAELAGFTPATVTALAAHVYPAPSIKTRPLRVLPFGARVLIGPPLEGFVPLAGGGHLCAAHLAPLPGDAVAVAERFLGAPYLWGGRSAQGLDCSALVQLALEAVGHRVPRDSDMQAALLGEALAPGDPPARGDLLFWRGHVAMATDAGHILHATAHAMAVVREPLAAVTERVAASGGGSVIARRRPGRARDWRPGLAALIEAAAPRRG